MRLPQTIFYKGCKIAQSADFRITIYEGETIVFEARCGHGFTEKELMRIVDFYRSLA